jgi:UDP-N-acetylmuramoylalanine--D-glutamate ligase
MDIRGKRVLVMGLGVHGGGLGVARFLVEQGANVTVTDLRSAEQLAPTLAQLQGLPVRFVLGQHRDEDFQTADLVIRNPGVPRESRYLQLARDNGAAIEMEMTLFFRLCPGPIIGITGTKGKTTTTLLAGAMFKEQFPDTVVAGNLRVSALEQLPKIGPRTPVVLELSSWQLEGLGEAGLSPRWACITNISPDHLDRYASMKEYIEAKQHIYKHQGNDGVVVLNVNDPVLVAAAAEAPGTVAWFSDEYDKQMMQFVEEHPHEYVVSWAERFLFWQHGMDNGIICAKSEIQLPGRHNLSNVAAAAALAHLFGVQTQHIRSAMQSFTGVPDRMEVVGTVDGVRYINDTTATTPTAAIAALRSIYEPTVLIAGGADKQLDFEEFGQVVAKYAKAVMLLDGTATPKVIEALNAAIPQLPGRAPIIHGPVSSMAAALEAARDLAEQGDVVLLSPGCASFGMFKNEFDRGEQFRQIVREWA